MIWQVVLSTAMFAAPPQGFVPSTPESEAPANVIRRCLVSVIDDIKVPAQEPGVITSIEVKEGDLIKRDQHLAQISDSLARKQKRVAEAELAVARLKAEDDVNILYSSAAFAVSQKELQMYEEANRVRQATGAVEMNKLRLQVEQARLQIKKSENEHTIAVNEAEAYTAKVDLADEQVRRREIKTPIDGEVVEILARPGEWVEPGNPVFRIVGMQKLRVEGFAYFAKLAPAAANKRPVTVQVMLSNGRVETFPGKIVFVNPVVLAGGMYRVWAEVENRLENGEYLLRPGIEAEMTIDLGVQASLPGVSR